MAKKEQEQQRLYRVRKKRRTHPNKKLRHRKKLGPKSGYRHG